MGSRRRKRNNCSQKRKPVDKFTKWYKRGEGGGGEWEEEVRRLLTNQSRKCGTFLKSLELKRSKGGGKETIMAPEYLTGQVEELLRLVTGRYSGQQK